MVTTCSRCLILFIVSAGCHADKTPPQDAGADAPPCTMVAELGVGGQGAQFTPLSEGDTAEIILGYPQ